MSYAQQMAQTHPSKSAVDMAAPSHDFGVLTHSR